MIMDTMFPDRKPCSADSANTIIGRRIGIPCKISDKYGLYEELSTIKCYVFTIYQLEMIILSFMPRLTSSTTYSLHHFMVILV